MKPLEGIMVLDFSQYLAGPSAALRLADLGARVIKIERTGVGDGSRKMKLHNLDSMGDSVLFQTINRNKESFCANLKSKEDLEMVKELISHSDIMIENFRPGVMKKMGLDYDSVKKINPGIIYGTVTGYGSAGPWAAKPGQDLLVQSISGLAWLNGDQDQPPMPFALSLADSYAGIHLAEGIMACLFRRFTTGQGGRVEVSLLESVLDLQFEVLTTWLNDGKKSPLRSSYHNAHAYLSAPYGIYQTADEYIALAMGSVTDLGVLLECQALSVYTEEEQWFTKRDEIKEVIGKHLATNTTAYWLGLLEPGGFWCSDVFTWEKLIGSSQFQAMDLLLNIRRNGGPDLFTPRCPIHFGEKPFQDNTPAPTLGEHTEKIRKEFALNKKGGNL
jgi:crotonobetainyl-CoA:carnitine CoA-transferase CaiB-like acyl-CoA transferase